MIDFTTLQGLTIPEGVVTQIADASGRVLWKLETSKPIVLEVAKQTLTTYAGETSYADESFILLDIYPKTNGTVKVTYGGLTKTITDTSGAEEPNAQQVFFGTFNGVSDSVVTPASGELTIEGAYNNFTAGRYQKSTKTTGGGYCDCVTDIVDWGDIINVKSYAFYNCTNLALTSLPSGLTSIDMYAFYNCTNLALTSLPSGLTSIGRYAFYNCTNLALTSLPEGLTIVKAYAFGVDHVSTIGSYRETITLPSTIQSIDETAFTAGDDTISTDYYWIYRNIVILATTPPILVPDSNQNHVIYAPDKITVPAGCGDAYKAADGWRGYKIVEVS